MYVDHWKHFLETNKTSWQQILHEQSDRKTSVLFCTSVGASQTAVVHDSVLAVALTMRDVKVEMLLCDGILPACEACSYKTSLEHDVFLEKGPQSTTCRRCWKQGYEVFSDLELPLHRYSQYLQPEDYTEAREIVQNLKDEELSTFVLDDIDLGEEAYAGTLRYFRVGDFSIDSDAILVMRRYLQGAILTYRAIERIFTQLKPEVAVFHHGIYVPQGVIGKTARKLGIRVVNWSIGYRSQTFIYSHGETYHYTMLDEPITTWKDRDFDETEKDRIVEYLESRRIGVKDWISYNSNPQENIEVIQEALKLDSRPTILLLTNVTWDAQLYYKNNAFPSLTEWLEFTINYFAQRQDLQLVIRIHPAEAIRGKTRQPVAEEIAKRFPTLPPNVYVVDAANNLSTYTLAELSNCVLIYGTKTGVELSARGIPVVVAGEAWVRNKDITIDVSSREEYLQCLEQLPLSDKMSGDRQKLALQYAHHYFFRRLIPIKAIVHYQNPNATVENEASNNENIILRKLRKLFSPKDLYSFLKTKSLPVMLALREYNELLEQSETNLKTKIAIAIVSFVEQFLNGFLGILKRIKTFLVPFDKEPQELQYTIEINSIEQLQPGRDRGLDTVCQGILTGSDFVFDEFQKLEEQQNTSKILDPVLK